eukprot:m.80205 g.80205  ORF g.80205 m.80205 type:complete len:206 (-) comp14831_c0_seq1:674-1291(-)
MDDLRTIMMPDTDDCNPMEDGLCEVLMIASAICPRCSSMNDGKLLDATLMGLDNTLIFVVSCDSCGHRVNETSKADILNNRARRTSLTLTPDNQWQSTKVLKSQTAMFSIPEIGLESASVASSPLMTAEAVLRQLRLEIGSNAMVSAEMRAQLVEFISTLDQVIEGTIPATLVMEDSESNSAMLLDGADFSALSVKGLRHTPGEK